jgi:hypothetical protein
MRMAMMAEAMNGHPQVTLNTQATIAPNVTSSPWAKLVSPVVPKISDKPMAHMAMMRPKRTPSTKSRAARSKKLLPLPPPPSPLCSG